MTIDIDDEIEYDLDDETSSKKEADITVEFNKILAKHAKDAPISTKYEWTKRNWKYVRTDGEYEGYVGSIHVETVYKFPKTGRGKVFLWDEYIRVFNNEKLVASHKIEYVDGFRKDYNDELDYIIKGMINQ